MSLPVIAVLKMSLFLILHSHKQLSGSAEMGSLRIFTFNTEKHSNRRVFKTMSSPIYFILSVIIAVVVVTLVCLILVWWKLKKMASRLWDEYHETMANGGFAPPMRIDLEPIDSAVWSDSTVWSDIDKIQLITTALEDLGYEPDGLFEATAPFLYSIQGFQNKQIPIYAALKELKHTKTIHLDLFTELSNGTQIRITDAPDDGMDQPEFSHILRYDDLDLSAPEQISKMHQRLVDEIQNTTAIDLANKHFAEVFKNSWAKIMDWRMERGGITTEEIIRVSAKEGRTDLSDEEIEILKRPWKQQIDLFITDLIRQSFFNSTDMPRDQQKEMLDRLVIVHENSTPTRLISTLADTITFNNDLNENKEDVNSNVDQKLKTIFDTEASVIDAFRQAMDLLPAERQYILQCSTETPWKSDIYLSPKYYDKNQ